MKIELVLQSVVSALERIHVPGSDAEMLAGAIKAVKNVIAAIEKAKEEQQNEHHDQHGQNLPHQLDVGDNPKRRQAHD